MLNADLLPAARPFKSPENDQKATKEKAFIYNEAITYQIKLDPQGHHLLLLPPHPHLFFSFSLSSNYRSYH